MKRKPDSFTRPSKRTNSGRTKLPDGPTTCTDVAGGKSARELAQPYLLAKAKVPINAFGFTWSVGRNRPTNEKHLQTLHGIFRDQKLQREYDEHHVLGICTREEVERMLQYSSTTSHGSGLWPAFDDWNEANNSKIEIIAGQHRIKTLEKYARSLKLRDDQLWWICDIYDRDTLPHEILIKLRANRPDATLPDSHGQIWTELATIAATNPELFQGNSASIEREMREILGLSGRVRFPTYII